MNANYITFEGYKYLLGNALAGDTPVSFTGNTVSGSATVSNVSSTVGLLIGMNVVASNVPAGTYITAIGGVSNTVTLSQTATSTVSSPSTVTFWAFGNVNQNSPLTVHLLQGAIPLGPATTFSQLTEATFDGYQPQQAVYPFVCNDPDGENVACAGGLNTFTPTDYSVSNNISGFALTYLPPGASAPTLVAVTVFPQIAQIQKDGDIVRVWPTLSFAYDQTNSYPSPTIP